MIFAFAPEASSARNRESHAIFCNFRSGIDLDMPVFGHLARKAVNIFSFDFDASHVNRYRLCNSKPDLAEMYCSVGLLSISGFTLFLTGSLKSIFHL
jgi:hypothetical protein